jgi:hypothetical protein
MSIVERRRHVTGKPNPVAFDSRKPTAGLYFGVREDPFSGV